MATEVVKACISRGIPVAPTAFCGPGKEGQLTITEGDTSVEVTCVRGPAEDSEPAVCDEALQSLLGRFPGLVCVDYTHPSAVAHNVDCYTRNRAPFVLGTTGGSLEDIKALVARRGPSAVVAPNMGKQLVAMQAALEYIADRFPGAFSGYELRVAESHQSSKADTSGTAKAVTASLAALAAVDPAVAAQGIAQVRDEEGQLAFGVPPRALGGHAFHTYELSTGRAAGGDSVQFVLQHNVCGRRVYAEGTADAAVFLAQRLAADARGCEGRVFSMVDVLEAGGMK
eukprot:CAMPEP_0198428994 /NCGR_PEP_ID=MMETSP1452-20131203/6912_1 /TAXON_ID=1181717 /ORGANISM="Synchroma pusillum, Strain CCMP3072" /LENGTH=283 /DNA_ID=CAMNT_0044149395 /DNA_START=1 /DNA_END=852 /DNA_ORIENTATION=+